MTNEADGGLEGVSFGDGRLRGGGRGRGRGRGRGVSHGVKDAPPPVGLGPFFWQGVLTCAKNGAK